MDRENQNHRQLLDGVFGLEAELAERERLREERDTEVERVRSARRACMQELENRKDNVKIQ